MPVPPLPRRLRLAMGAGLLLAAGGVAVAVAPTAGAAENTTDRLAAPSAAGVTINIDQTERAVARQFWTAERMRDNDRELEPGPGEIIAKPWTGPATKGVGRLFWQWTWRDRPTSDPVYGSCTATAIPSSNHDVAITARHCLEQALPEGPNTVKVFNLVFVPRYADGAAPDGIFSVRSMVMPPDHKIDVAMVVLDPNAKGEHVADAGTQNVDFSLNAPGRSAIFGYPVSFNSFGQVLKWCDAPADPDPTGTLWLMDCDMEPGSSGGPWLTNFDEQTGIGTIYTVTSGGLKVDDPANPGTTIERQAGSKLGNLAESLLRQAEKI